jgi:alkylation response protein AidB-like acyl-CoA dehydrogenase
MGGSGESVAGLIAAVRARRAEFESAGERAEAQRSLPADAVATLRSLGAFWLKTPRELGGTPATPLEFCDVMEEFAYADTATAWTVMVGNGGTGTVAGWLPDAGARIVFAPGRPPPIVIGVPRAAGTGVPVPGGYLVSGRWTFASGVAHADWLLGGFRVVGEDGQAGADVGGRIGRALVCVVPRSAAEVLDDWHVAGLRGTGSPSFRLDSVFVPAELTFDRGGGACRGGALFRQEEHVFLSNELPPLFVGMARRAVDQMASLASRTARFPDGPVVGQRAVFQAELGRAQTKIRAARAVHREAIAAAWAAALAGEEASPAVHAAVTAASIFAAETCTDVINGLFRYAGGRALALTEPMQRHLRNALAARQHIGLSEEFYETVGRLKIASSSHRP